MAKKPLPTPDELRQLLRYEPETGRFFWKPRVTHWFRDTPGRTKEHACANWNARYAGTEAFTTSSWSGHKFAHLFGRNWAAHRVAWAILHGAWPDREIDHINGNPADNRAANLRAVGRAENARNLPVNPTNTSGVMGVGWHKQSKRWRAYIGFGKTRKHLGLFPTFEEAVAARRAEEAARGYHANHGKRLAHGQRRLNHA